MTTRHFGEHHDEIIAMAELLKATWDRVDPRSSVSLYPASYWETFLDMAKAVIAARYADTPDTADPAEAIAAEHIGDIIFGALGDAGWDVSSAQHGAQVNFRIDHSHRADDDLVSRTFTVTPVDVTPASLPKNADSAPASENDQHTGSTESQLQTAIRQHATVVDTEKQRMHIVLEFARMEKPARFKRGERSTLALATELFPFLDHVDEDTLHSNAYLDIVGKFSAMHFAQEALTPFERTLLHWAERVFKFLRPEDYRGGPTA